ncbi:MAG: hypothetical protein ACC726_16355 [Chloroflexota bacterium]
MNQPFAPLVLLGALALALVPACGDPTPGRRAKAEPAHRLLADAGEVRLDPADGGLGRRLADAFDALDLALKEEPALQALVVAQPDEGATLAGDDQPPRFLWRDPAEAADTWWIGVRFGQRSGIDLRLLVPGGRPVEAVLDPFSLTLQAWTPSPEVWRYVVEHATGTPAVVTFVGFAADAPNAPLSRGSVTTTVSETR